MAHLHRVGVLFILGLLACLLASPAGAVVLPEKQYTVQPGWDTFGPVPYSGLQTACEAYAAAFRARQGGPETKNIGWSADQSGSGNVGWCGFDVWYYGSYSFNTGAPIYTAAAACPSNSTLDAGGSSCSCSTGYEEANGQCIAQKNDCEKLAGQSAGPSNFEGRGDEYFYCDGWNGAAQGKCVVKVLPLLRFESPPGSGHWFSQGEGRYTGQKATACNGAGNDGGAPSPSTPKPEDGVPPATPDPGTAAPAPCPVGQAPGEVNGQRVCAPRGTDGKVEEKSTSSSTNAAGDKTDTTKETKCDGGQCTTTTTNCTTLNGQTSANCTSTSTTGSASGTCKAGSGLAMCGEGSTQTGFSGNCAAGFKAVSDDAVINAMAEETYRQNCKVNPDEASQALAKTNVDKEGSQTGTLPGNAAVSIGPGSFDTSDALGGGAACMPDLTVSVLGRPQTLPFSVLCDYLGYMGGVLLAVSFLLAARIVTRG